LKSSTGIRIGRRDNPAKDPHKKLVRSVFMFKRSSFGFINSWEAKNHAVSGALHIIGEAAPLKNPFHP